MRYTMWFKVDILRKSLTYRWPHPIDNFVPSLNSSTIHHTINLILVTKLYDVRTCAVYTRSFQQNELSSACYRYAEKYRLLMKLSTLHSVSIRYVHIRIDGNRSSEKGIPNQEDKLSTSAIYLFNGHPRYFVGNVPFFFSHVLFTVLFELKDIWVGAPSAHIGHNLNCMPCIMCTQTQLSKFSLFKALENTIQFTVVHWTMCALALSSMLT